MTRLSKAFPSRKNPRSIQSKSSTSSSIIISPIDSNNNHNKKSKATEIVASSSSPKSKAKTKETKGKRGSQWSVYLVISSTLPRTYVGVTTNFPRRLKQHNGELKGGAKASSAGRPWNLACLVRGFKDLSEGVSIGLDRVRFAQTHIYFNLDSEPILPLKGLGLRSQNSIPHWRQL